MDGVPLYGGLTAPEVAVALGVSMRKLASMIDNGEFPKPRIGGGKGSKRIWTRAQMERWMDRAD